MSGFVMSFIEIRWIDTCCLVPISALILIVLIIISVVGQFSRKERKIVLLAILATGLILSASIFSLFFLVDLDSERYNITIMIDDEVNNSEPIHLILPIPEHYPDDYSSFYAQGIGSREFQGSATNFPPLTISIISTSYGNMLSVSTNTSVLLTSYRNVERKLTRDHNAKFVSQDGDKVPVNLANTTQLVSIAVYHELEFNEGIVSWESRYSAIAKSPPVMDDLYHDGTLEKLTEDRRGGDPILLDVGWQNLTLHTGSFGRST